MSHHAVPRIELNPDHSVVVTRWGRVGDLLLRAGDRLVLDVERQQGLLLLVASGFGRPMLGRRAGGRLLAEPGGVPASPDRWRQAAGVAAVERELERGGPGGAWQVAVVLHPTSTHADPDAARAALPGGQLAARQLEQLMVRAALAPERFGVEVSLGAAKTAAAAQALAEAAAPCTLRFEVGPDASTDARHVGARPAAVKRPTAPLGQLVAGPWGRREAPQRRRRWSAQDVVDAQVQLRLFGDTA